MKKHFKNYLVLAIKLLSVFAVAQNQTKKWYFGAMAGIDFVPGTPLPMTTG